MSNTFRKQLLRFGSYVHPNDPKRKMVIDQAVVDKAVANFKSGVIGEVPVPWTHTDDASQNTGFIRELIPVEDGLDMVVEFKDPQAADKAGKQQIPGVSAGLDFNYVDKRTGEAIGPTVLHAALVNHPYLKGMRQFEAVSLSEGSSEVFVLSEEESDVQPEEELTKEDVLDVLKQKFGTDVAAMEARIAELEDKAALSEKIVAKLVGSKVMLSENDDPMAALDKVFGENTNLSEKVNQLVKKDADRDAEERVRVLLSEGKIVPAQKEHFKKLAIAGAITDDFVKAMPTVVDLTERGHDATRKAGGGLSDDEAKAEVARITKDAGWKK